MTSMYENLISQAKANPDSEAAIADFKKAYEIKQTFEINQILVADALNGRQFEAGWHLAHEFVDEYGQASADIQELYLRSSLKANYFIEARQFMLTYVSKNLAIENEIEVAEQAYRQTQKATMQTIQKSFYHLTDLPMGEQSSIIANAKKLPEAEFVFCAKSILMDPFGHQLTRVSVLDELIKLHYDEMVEMQSLIGTTIQVQPSQILPLTEQPIYKTVMQRLDQSPLANDPSQFMVSKQQFTLCLMLLMPNLDQAISDVQTWMEQTLLMFGMEFTTQRQENSEQLVWRQALSDALMQL